MTLRNGFSLYNGYSDSQRETLPRALSSFPMFNKEQGQRNNSDENNFLYWASISFASFGSVQMWGSLLLGPLKQKLKSLSLRPPKGRLICIHLHLGADTEEFATILTLRKDLSVT